MQVLFKKVLSLHEDGATCHLIIIQEKYKIMLDCGINHSFQFNKYQQISHELKDVQLVLISHSALQYSGAYPFLISELGMNPNIFYTTQPIMRYSPLNLHEQILNLRMQGYDKKIFNRIYSQYEEMNLIKPYQKQQIQLHNIILANPLLEKKENSNVIKKLNFCCYLAGGYLGSVYWRISYGLVNILYLVDYNNYNMYHIGGLDIDNLKNQNTHLLITDVYPPSEKTDIKKDKLYIQLKQKLLNFYQKNAIDPNKPKPFNIDYDNKLLISCYPNQLVVEVLATMRKIIVELEGGHDKIQKIGVVHLSSRFLQLVKSQSQYFQIQFKGMLQKLNQFFEQSLFLNKRINICTLSSIRGILLDSKNANTQLFHIGVNDVKQCKQKTIGWRNLRPMKIFDKEDMRLQKSASKLSVSKIEEEGKNQDNEHSMQIQYSINELKIEQYQNYDENIKDQLIQKKHIKSKYISSINGFPKFIFSKLEKDEEITDFGLRHHTDLNENVQKKTIYDCKPGQKIDTFEEKLAAKKQSKIEVMNIHFDLPPQNNSLSHFTISNFVKNVHITEYQSSLKLIQLIKPKNIIFVNTPPNPKIFTNYQNTIEKFSTNGDSNQSSKRVKLFDSNVKKHCYLSFENELLQYRMNYLAQTQQEKVQRVHGRIVKHGNSLHIHLDCLQNKKIVSFRLEKFYSKMKQKMRCRFIGSGIEIDGIKLYRKNKQIVLQGQYSEEYFKVRKELYEFLGIK